MEININMDKRTKIVLLLAVIFIAICGMSGSLIARLTTASLDNQMLNSIDRSVNFFENSVAQDVVEEVGITLTNSKDESVSETSISIRELGEVMDWKDVLLMKRNAWMWWGITGAAALLTAAASGALGYTVNGCGAIGWTAPQCWAVAGVELVMVGASQIVSNYAAYRAGSAAGNAKRDTLGTAIYIDGPEFDELHAIFKESKFDFVGVAYSNLTSSSEFNKRDNITDQAIFVIKSTLGTHAIHPMNLHQVDVARELLSQDNPGSLEATIGNFKKRSGFDANWVSWNYDNSNEDLSRIVANDEAYIGIIYDGNWGNWWSSTPDWKYCMSPTVNPHPGQSEGYDQLGDGNAAHGELYFNTYGGVDGFCNDNKDGAQCSDYGC